MKKSIIKRRKRVVAASQSEHGSPGPQHSPAGLTTYQQSPDSGSMNEDGSVNLRRNFNSIRHLPEPSMNIGSQQQQQQQRYSLAVDYTGFRSSSAPSPIPPHQTSPQRQQQNELPPMNTFPSPSSRHDSLSPHPGASRKRSLSAVDREGIGASDGSDSNRPNSIKSILNPTQNGTTSDPTIDPALSSKPLSASGSGKAGDSGTGKSRAQERRAELEREARVMREQLAAKERELAALGMDEHEDVL
jgi:GATA-binding protein, other eukaryote